MEIFEQKFKIELTEITMNFGIKPTTILKYMQETFARYCAKYNIAGYDVYEMGLKWVLGRTVVEYLDIIPLWSEEITVKAYVASAQRLRMYLNFDIATSRGPVARVQSTAYILDYNTSRPTPVDKMLKMFQIDKDELKGEVIKCDFKNEGDIISKHEHKVGLSDIDFNNHTNNISYVSYALASLPKEQIVYGFPKLLDIKYLKETFLGDTLNCEIRQSGKNYEHTITDGKDGSLVCIVNSVWDDKSYSREYFIDLIKNEKKNFFS